MFNLGVDMLENGDRDLKLIEELSIGSLEGLTIDVIELLPAESLLFEGLY